MTVTDNPEAHQYEHTEDGHLARLVYRFDGTTMVLTHTEVPEELGGRGLGGTLVRAALERAKADNLTLRPECPFAAKWLRDHPDDVADVAIDWP